VGDAIVQASIKEPLNGVGNFNWKWVGLDGIRSNGIIPLIKSAIEDIPHWHRTIFGWDVIVDDKPWVIEINTSPGVNDASAKRIVEQIEKVV